MAKSLLTVWNLPLTQNNSFFTKVIKFSFFAILVICSNCAPKLNLYQIEKKINIDYEADFQGDIEYMLKSIPVKDIDRNGIERYRKAFKNIYNNKRKYPVNYSDIGELDVKGNGKCHSYNYYDVTYLVTKSQMTPYIDSSALERNYKKYGKENVYFNKSSKILDITERKHKILVLDKDRVWKILSYDIKSLEESFGDKFAKCIDAAPRNVVN